MKPQMAQPQPKSPTTETRRTRRFPGSARFQRALGVQHPARRMRALPGRLIDDEREAAEEVGIGDVVSQVELQRVVAPLLAAQRHRHRDCGGSSTLVGPFRDDVRLRFQGLGFVPQEEQARLQIRLLCRRILPGAVDLKVDVERLPVHKHVADAGNNLFVVYHQWIALAFHDAESLPESPVFDALGIFLGIHKTISENDGAYLELLAVQRRNLQGLLEGAELAGPIVPHQELQFVITGAELETGRVENLSAPDLLRLLRRQLYLNDVPSDPRHVPLGILNPGEEFQLGFAPVPLFFKLDAVSGELERHGYLAASAVLPEVIGL